MKQKILNAMLYLARFAMSFIYFFIKIFPTQKNKITMLSRQSNDVNIDFEMLQDEFYKQNPNIKIKILCRKIPKGFIAKIKYCFFMIKCFYHIATSRVCIVDGYSIPVSSLKHKKSLIIVQIWHALGATKKFGYQVLGKKEGSNSNVARIMKMHKNYTFVTCASNATKKFYSEAFGVDSNKVLTLGMPRIDYLLGKDEKIKEKAKKLLEHYPMLKDKPVILYVPTFRKGEGANVYDVIHAVPEEKYNLLVQLHPLDNTKIDKKYVVSKDYDTFTLLEIADYVITDYSAIAFESCVMDKQTYFYLYDIDEYENNRGLNVPLKEEMPSVTSSKIEDIINVIEENTYPVKELEAFKQKYVETADTQNTERIVKYIFKLMEEKYGR